MEPYFFFAVFFGAFLAAFLATFFVAFFFTAMNNHPLSTRISELRNTGRPVLKFVR
jgi:hypothetical protein